MKVHVKTPSRLHISMIDLQGSLGRLYGSIGLTIDTPRLALSATTSDSITVGGSRTSRAEEYARKMYETYSLEGGINIDVLSDIPQHSGFGSGTQLALAVGTVVSMLHGLNLSPEEISLTLGRSQRSSIGMYSFKQGGFIIDGGHRTPNDGRLPPLLFRAEIPSDWRFVIGLPEITSTRSGKEENHAFSRLEPPPDSLIAEASHIVLLQMMPSILEADISIFGEAMTRLDSIFGGYWEKVQGGRYSHPAIEAGVHFLQENGAYGIGQSSWGPAFYGLSKRGESNTLEASLREHFSDSGLGGIVFTSEPNNSGAMISVEGD